ncbi:MAG: hypothetical protein U9Q83_05360 [Bacteroidota bacterium]|nr:hypothetical protein [Bacteroidota bacterium]
MHRKLLFISVTNLTVNPRLLNKRTQACCKLGDKVDFVGLKLGSWSDKIDEEEMKNLNANFHYIYITRNSLFQRFLSSVIEKISKKIISYLKQLKN